MRFRCSLDKSQIEWLSTTYKCKVAHINNWCPLDYLTLCALIETIISLQDQPAAPPSHYQNIPYQPKTTVPIGYPESNPDTNYQSSHNCNKNDYCNHRNVILIQNMTWPHASYWPKLMFASFCTHHYTATSVQLCIQLIN